MPVFQAVPSSAQRTIAVLGDAWTLRILRTVFRGKRRYSDFIADLGVSRAVLSDRVDKLVANQVLARVAADGSHPDYRLTERGLDLWTLFIAMWQWEATWGTGPADQAPAIDRPRATLTHLGCGQAMQPQLVCLHCQATVLPFDTAAEAGPGFAVASTAATDAGSRFRRGRKSGEDPTSPGQAHTLMRVVGDRWNSAVVAAAFKGSKLFSEFEKDLGIGPNQLSDRIGELTRLGILRTRAYAGERQEYRLTHAGLAIYPVTLELMRWGDRWLWPEGAALQVRHKPCGQLLGAGWRCGHCLEALERDQVRMF
jgi:DNA-binding HxlR family transcriptional regulator